MTGPNWTDLWNTILVSGLMISPPLPGLKHLKTLHYLLPATAVHWCCISQMSQMSRMSQFVLGLKDSTNFLNGGEKSMGFLVLGRHSDHKVSMVANLQK